MRIRGVIFTGFLLSGKLFWGQVEPEIPGAPINSTPSAALVPAATPPAPSVVPAAALAPAVAPLTPKILPAPAPASDPLNHDRIFKLIPDYQTVENSNGHVAPLTPREKWRLAWKNTTDPFNLISAAANAAWSEATNSTPKYGHGGAGLGERFGAGVADFSIQNFVSTGVFANVLHEDPRYFRKGPSAGFWTRVGASLKQIAVARSDSGTAMFNGSHFLGMATAIGISNLYYPPSARRGDVMMGRVVSQLTGDVMGNLMSEFWPDVRNKLFHKKQH